MNYAVFCSAGFQREIQNQKKGFFTSFSSHHKGCAVDADIKKLSFFDPVEKKKVELCEETPGFDRFDRNLLKERRYPKGTLKYNNIGDSNPYIVCVPAASFSEAVSIVKSGIVEYDSRFTIGEWISYRKGTPGMWSIADHDRFSPLVGTKWEKETRLPSVVSTWINGGVAFASQEEAQENQESRWALREEGLPGDWNTILRKDTWVL